MSEQSGLTVLRIRGVSLKLHVSLLILMTYVVLVAGLQLQFVARQAGIELGQIRGGPLVWGLAFAIALLVSVALHEFGHVLMAQRLGCKVSDVTLMFLGGVSRIEKFPDRRYGELKISLAGPLVSFALGGVLLWLRSRTHSPAISLFSYWIGRANLVLGTFNLLPAFPTDGGRALRSLLSARIGNIRATEAAVGVSKAFAWVFGLVGLLQFNLILMLIAVFIYTAAKNELRVLLGKTLLQGMRAEEVGVRTRVVDEDANLGQAAWIMVHSSCLVLPVRTKNGSSAIIGAEYLRAIPESRWKDVKVSQVMARAPQAIESDETIERVAEELLIDGAAAAPMLENGEPVGVVRAKDLTETMELKALEKILTFERNQEFRDTWRAS